MLSKEELRDARRDLAQIIHDHGFTNEITPQTVSKLTEEGFDIGGSMVLDTEKGKGSLCGIRGRGHLGESSLLKN